MIRDHLNLKTWTEITRFGIPEFVVRKPMLWESESLVAGDVFPGVSNLGRTRTLYNRHMIAVKPVEEKKKNKRK